MPQGEPDLAEPLLERGTEDTGLEGGGVREGIECEKPVAQAQIQTSHVAACSPGRVYPSDHAGATTIGHHGHVVAFA